MSERLTRRMSDGTAVFAEKSKSFYSAQIYEEAREKNRQILNRLCDLCGSRTTRFFHSDYGTEARNEAINAWNRRAENGKS